MIHTKEIIREWSEDQNCIKKDNWDSEQQALWNFLLHAENVLTSRTNFFLVAESMFIAALSAGISSYRTYYLLSSLITIGGLIISIIWLLLGLKIYIRINGIVFEVKKFFPLYGEILTKYNFPVSSTMIIAFAIPTVFIIGWLIILFKL